MKRLNEKPVKEVKPAKVTMIVSGKRKLPAHSLF
jgi:hypothetical protein